MTPFSWSNYTKLLQEFIFVESCLARFAGSFGRWKLAMTLFLVGSRCLKSVLIAGMTFCGGAIGTAADTPAAPKTASDAKAPAPALNPAPAAKPATAAAEPAATAPAAQSPSDKTVVKPAAPRKRYRPLAPGAMITIDPNATPGQTVNWNDVVEILAVDPKLDFAKDVPFRREIWALEFQFKPMRIVDVDLPQPGDRMQRKPIWYMLYKVTNTGKALQPVPTENGKFDLKTVDKPVRFIPTFLLEIPALGKSYRDRVIPIAVAAVRMREDPNREIFNTADIPRELKVGESAWGVATWEDIDPKVTRFSVFAAGLTNAQRWSDDPGKFQPGKPLGTGRHLSSLNLKLNFRRPGDEFRVTESQILYGDPDDVDYSWEYR